MLLRLFIETFWKSSTEKWDFSADFGIQSGQHCTCCWSNNSVPFGRKAFLCNFKMSTLSTTQLRIFTSIGQASEAVYWIASRTSIIEEHSSVYSAKQSHELSMRASHKVHLVRARNSVAVPHSWHPNCRGQIDPVADDWPVFKKRVLGETFYRTFYG